MSSPNRDEPAIRDVSACFLSALRPGPTPSRTPPTSTSPSEPAMQADDYATRYGLAPADFEDPAADPEADAHVALGHPVRALIGAELGGDFLDAARRYAAHGVAEGGRTGLILLDRHEVRLHLVEHDPSPADLPPERARPTHGRLEDPALRRRVAEALAELDYDVDRWLLLLPDPRLPEARRLLEAGAVEGLTLLTRPGHDGVVAGYRALKRAVGDLGDACPADLTLAVLDAKDEAEARAAQAKLIDVTRQFLDRPLRGEGRVGPAATVGEHGILWLRSREDGPDAEPADAHWRTVAAFLADAAEARYDAAPDDAPDPLSEPEDESEPEMVAPNPAVKIKDPAPAPFPMPKASAPQPEPTPAPTAGDEVIDLPGGAADPASVLRAALAGSADLAATAVAAPMLPGGHVALDRDGTLTLIAAADADLSGLAQVSAALTWLTQSASLVRMAMPQMHVADAPPRLRLLIDHRATRATDLGPLLATGRVTLVPYRTLKWGGRTGLLLDAA